MQVQVPDNAAREMVQALGADTVSFNGAKIHLLKAPPTITPAVRWGDLQEADFSGYGGAAAVAWGTAFNDPLGNGVLAGPAITFAATDETVSNTIYGYALTTGGATPSLLLVATLDTPIPITKAGDAIVIVPFLSLPGVLPALVYGP
jgi:hypothetical protein